MPNDSFPPGFMAPLFRLLRWAAAIVVAALVVLAAYAMWAWWPA